MQSIKGAGRQLKRRRAAFAAAPPLSGAPTPTAAGTTRSFTLPAGAQRYVAIRAVDAHGNIGLPAVVRNPGAEGGKG